MTPFLASDQFYIGLSCGLAGIIAGAITGYILAGYRFRRRLPSAFAPLRAATERLAESSKRITDCSAAWKSAKGKAGWPVNDPDLRGSPAIQREVSDHGREYLFAKPALDPFTPVSESTISRETV